MLIANIYGRLGADPVARTTKAGKDMATVSVAVDVAPWNADAGATLWVSVLGFGTTAEAMLRAEKGQMLAAVGKLSRGSYTTAAGEVREQWSLMADSVVTAKSAKPTGGRRAAPTQADRPKPGGSDRGFSEREPPPFDDDLPF
ncbi:single-stranded DNA-binding protein [uncultured Thiodictyon sp.]|jgi:single-strand DNA-binding protein|uniref:single-stranded DNA-binding protein n=1 Tax=uncultured Thiodictyon sp. TaxID=1846217 RepID=UPI0025DABAB4|nr:single-stranded DNA-binding protein [uncultured Thiodictyon sp.]